MPVWLIALIVAALGGGGALVFFGNSGGSSSSNDDFWTPEVCNERIEADVADFEEYQVTYGKTLQQAQDEARRGNAEAAATINKNAESWKESTKSLLTFVDSNIMPVCKGKVRQELLDKVEEARRFLGGVAPQAVQEEGMPDVRVTNIKSTFIPFEMDANGSCSGPYLDLVFTVTNQGANFPRPVDLQTYEERAQRPAKELQFLAVTGELDFGGDMKKRLDFEVKGDTGTLASGQSLELRSKVKVEHNQTHVRIKGSLIGHAFVKTGTEESPPYETGEIEIPIWDIYTESHSAIDGIDEDTKRYYIGTKGTVTNKGKTPTPGPIEASFIINEIDPHRRISSWSGKTDGPVAGNTDIYARTDSDKKLPTDHTVYSSIIPLCPNGKAGGLSDGNTKNNIRELQPR